MISEQTIALVKERTDLVALVGETVRLTKRGRSFTGLCPFHKEKTPSFHVNAERGFFHCFGCKESGGSIDFVMKIEGRSFPEAVRMLAERAGIEIEETLTDQERREAAAARKQKDDLYAVNALAASYFEHSLRGLALGASPPHALAKYALAELARRGFALAEETGHDRVGEDARLADTLQAFRVGYAPYAWDGLAAFFKKQGVSPLAAERVGLLVPRSSGSGHYDRFRHRLMFAVTDVMGRVIAFSGRALAEPTPDELRAVGMQPQAAGADAPAKYMNSPESPIYTKGEHLFGLHQARHAIRQKGEAVLVEGNFDVFSLHARGVSNVVAPLGTAFTSAQAKLLKRFAPRVIVLFDGDAAGRKATRAARGPCREGGLEAKVASLPQGVDPDDFVQKNGPKALESLLGASRGMLEHVLEDALSPDAFAGSSLAERLARVKAVVALIGEEDDPTQRALAKTYADRLSSELVVAGRAPTDLRQLEVLIEQATRPPRTDAIARTETTAPRERARSRAQEADIPLAILGVLLDFPDLATDAEVTDALGALEGDAAIAYIKLRERVAQGPRALLARPLEGDEEAHSDPGLRAKSAWTADDFLAILPPSVHAFAVERLASPQFEVAGDAKAVLLDNARKLESLTYKRENRAMAELTEKAEAQGDVASVDAHLREIQRLAMKKRGLL